MKALILSVGDKRHMSMVAPYEEYFRNRHIKYDVIRMNRYVPTSDVIHTQNENVEIYEYPFVMSTSAKKIKKLIPFLKFKKFAKGMIKKNEYDFIVVWNENTALLFADILLRMKGNYCFNQRDILEVPFTKKLLEKIVDCAYFNTTPTPADAFGKREQYITLYNRDVNIFNNVSRKEGFKEKGRPLNLVFMGRYGAAPDTFKKTIDILGNDERYELFFYGDGFDTELDNFAKSRGIRNVTTGGAFLYEDTFQYLKSADIINSYYDNLNNPNHIYAAGVKQSYTPMLYIPAIIGDNTTWAGISKKYGFSYCINDTNLNSLPDDLYNWYHNLDFEKFKQECDEFNAIVEQSRQKVFQLLDEKFNIKG